MATFTNFVFNSAAENPPQTGVSLSASNNSVVFLPTVTVYNTVTPVPNTVFTAPPLSATQTSAITGSSVLSGFYAGWIAYGSKLNAKYTDTQFNALTTIYASTALLSTQVALLTSRITSTSIFSSGNYKGVPVNGILFNQLSGASTASVTLSVTDRIQFKVAPEYNGATFCLYFPDRSTTTFTVATATATQVVTGAIGFDNRGPNERRRFAIEI
jgi:hypothetical protein